MNACLGTSQGEMSYFRPSVPVPFRGIPAFERRTVACLVEFVRQFRLSTTYGMKSASAQGEAHSVCSGRGIFDMLVPWHVLSWYGDLVGWVL